MDAIYHWKTYNIMRETHDTITIVFNTLGSVFSYTPGQYVHITLTINNNPVTRPYSLSSIEGERPSITVKRMDGGLMSNYIIDFAKTIEYWTVSTAAGEFYIPENTINATHTVLIAAGGGMSPVFSILKHELGNTSNKVVLININKTEHDVIYEMELAMLAVLYDDRFLCYNIFSRQQFSEKYTENTFFTRLSTLLLKKLIKKSVGESYLNAVYHICGPEGLVNMSEETLIKMGVDIGNIRKELFHTSVTTVALPDTVSEVLFHLNDTTYLLDVEPGQSILQAALDDKIPVQHSCTSGTCGVCAARLMSGEVFMAANYSLQEADLSDGYRLLCQSYPVHPYVEIDVQYPQENLIQLS